MFVTILGFSKDKFVEVFKLQNTDNEYFDLIFDNQDYREMFYNIFSFFISEKIFMDIYEKRFVMYVDNPESKDENDKYLVVGAINKSNFDVVRDVILQFNYCKDNNANEKPIGKHTAELIAKREKYRKQKADLNNESDSDFSLANIVSKLSAYSYGINLINIWDYTVFQIFDQFFTLNTKQSLDMANFSYSVWGGEYKVPKWYKNTFNKE